MNAEPVDEVTFSQMLAAPGRSAFRLELQPAYLEACEQGALRRYLAGTPDPPTQVPELAAWYGQVAALTRAGCAFRRVRVQEEPPTGYQRWERWIGRWNAEAGEDIRYLTRDQAHEVGLLPAAGDEDWWLLDDARLIVMRFDPAGRRVANLVTTDPAALDQARRWRDVAWSAALPEP